MRWDSRDHSDRKIFEYTGWRHLTNIETFQDRAGVYLFTNADLQVKYIGMAGAGRMVVEISSAIRRNKDYGATLVKAIYTNSTANARLLEGELIDKYSPPNNLR